MLLLNYFFVIFGRKDIFNFQTKIFSNKIALQEELPKGCFIGTKSNVGNDFKSRFEIEVYWLKCQCIGMVAKIWFKDFL